MPSEEELETQERFRSWYKLESQTLVEIERAVIGSDYGANGYTTRAQVEDVARRVELGPSDMLLDIGTGRGWPATYLAQTTGCSVVASDLPFEGLAIGKRRADDDGLTGRVVFVSARAEVLPLRPKVFDVVIHTDVLCWLRDKLSGLRASASVLRPNGRLAFLTIHPAAGLSTAALERAVAAGPPEVGVSGTHEALLTSAGFTTIEAVDVTAAFHQTQLAWTDRWSERKDDVVKLLGEKLYDDRQEERRVTLVAIEDGLLRRTLYIARLPAAG